MKYIKLFIASSIVEFHHEREALGNYIRSLNDIYVKRGLYFELIICEDLSDSVARTRKQEEYNRFIRDSQFFFIILGKEAGEYTVEEFDVALEQFRAAGAPLIYTYFKKLDGAVSPAESITRFIRRLDQELGHYYTEFEHLDTVKLKMLLELSRCEEFGMTLAFEDGQARVDNTPVLPLDNIPIYRRNENLQKLREEKAELDKKFVELRVEVTNKPDDDGILLALLDVSDKRNRLLTQIHQIEKDVLGLCNTIAAQNGSGKPLTRWQKEASRLFDQGDYDGVIALLQDGTRAEELAQAELLMTAGKDRLVECLDKSRWLIAALKAKGVDPDIFKEIQKHYEECCGYAREYHIEMDIFYEYASFLEDQNQYARGIEVAEELLGWYRYAGADDRDLAKLLNLLGNLLSEHSGRRGEAEELYREAKKIYSRLAEREPAVYEPDVAMTCNNLGALLCEDIGRRSEAEEQYRKAKKIYSRLAEREQAVYEPDVAMTCNNLGTLLSDDTGRRDEAEEQYRKAKEIYSRLAEREPAVYEPYVATICNNLGVLLAKDTGRRDEAEKLYRKALEIRTRLAEREPAVYEPDVATTCNNLGSLLAKDTGRRGEAEEMYRKALEIRTRLAEREPAVYEPDVAMTCNNLGALLSDDTGRRSEAEEQYRKAKKIYFRLAEREPAVYEPYVATTCNNLGNLLAKDTGRRNDAEELYRKALEIRTRLAEQNPAVYEPDVAMTCNNLGNLLSDDAGRRDEAEELYRKAKEIYSRLAEQEPAVYEPAVAMTCNNLGNLLAKDTGRRGDAEKLYKKALEIRTRLAEWDPAAYEPDVANTLFNMGIFLYKSDRKSEAKECFESAYALYIKYPHMKENAERVRRILEKYF